MPWLEFQVKRALYENQDKLGFFQMEGENRGKTYQIIYNSHEEDSIEKKDRIINGLKVFPVNSRVQLTGNWHVLARLFGTSVSLTTNVNPKDFKESTANIVQRNYSVPRESVFVRRQDDGLALMGALEAENELRKAKLKLEGGEQRALDIIDKLIPSKRVANESSRPADESSRPAPGNRQHTPPRTDGHGNREESSERQNEAPDRQVMDMKALKALQDSKAAGTNDDPIDLDEDEDMSDHAVPEIKT